MTISRGMDLTEIKVLNAIKKASFESPVKASKLREQTGLSKRNLENVIESLRVNFKQPIVAKKYKPSGYYLPRTEEERQAGTAPYRRQILTEQRNLATIMAIDLKEYWGEQA